MNDSINTLFLDEPTNHLDVLSREWLEDALEQFDQNMLFVSHDRYFINRFATRIWMVEDGRVTDFIGGYEEYTAYKARQEQLKYVQPKAQEHREKSEKPKSKNNSYQEKKLVKEIEQAIEKTEKELVFLDTELETYAADYERLAQIVQAKNAAEESLLALYEQYDSVKQEKTCFQ